MNDYKKEYARWLSAAAVDDETKKELSALAGQDEEIRLRFYSYLQFGTAGLRGVMRAGTNAMNVYTVAHATQGLASLIVKEGAEDRGTVIACDSRNNSEAFAKCAAEVLAGNGIKTYIFESLRPTPVLSFAVRHLACIAGINITASHNPKEYNGYKAYWEDGAQLPPEHAKTVSAFIEKTDIFDDIRRIPFEDGVKSGMIEIIGENVDRAYLDCVKQQLIDPEILREQAEDLKIVYSPLHGTGYRLVPQILREVGIRHLYTVPEQSVPDGNFPTAKFPNPEYKEVFESGIRIAEEIGSDLVIATDPDADRMGIAVKGADGQFRTLTGNQTGALLLQYIIAALKSTGKMPPHPYAVKSFVSTELVTKICAVENVRLFNVFTGFKFIGETIGREEIPGDTEFIFGFEESYGYLRGIYARDKDAVVASMLICEMAAYYKKRGMTLSDALEELYQKYGCYCDDVDNVYMEGLDGLQNIKKIMAGLRASPLRECAGVPVDAITDYSVPVTYDLKNGTQKETGTGTTDTMYYSLGGDVIVVRPSGTEPKIKFYYLVSGDTAEAAKEKAAAYKAAMKHEADRILLG